MSYLSQLVNIKTDLQGRKSIRMLDTASPIRHSNWVLW